MDFPRTALTNVHKIVFVVERYHKRCLCLLAYRVVYYLSNGVSTAWGIPQILARAKIKSQPSRLWMLCKSQNTSSDALEIMYFWINLREYYGSSISLVQVSGKNRKMTMLGGFKQCLDATN